MSSSTAKQKRQYTKRKDLAPLEIPALPIRTSQPSDDNYHLSSSSSSSMSYSPAVMQLIQQNLGPGIKLQSLMSPASTASPETSPLVPFSSQQPRISPPSKTPSEKVDKVLVVIEKHFDSLGEFLELLFRNYPRNESPLAGRLGTITALQGLYS